MNYRGCPDTSPLPAPLTRTIVPDPRPRRPRSSKGGAAAPTSSCTPQLPDDPTPNNCAQSRKSSSCNPEARWYNNPNNSSAFPRSSRFSARSPIPISRLSRTFPAGRADARPRKANQLLGWTFAIRCYWDLFGFYGNFCWCNVFHAIFSTFHKFLQLF
jgi:hypothetical protein